MRYLDGSPWIEGPADLTGPLAGDLRADVAIVGGGLTGLSTALALRSEGVDVVLLERDFAGEGASGRNAGHLTPTIGKDLPTLLRLYGKSRAAALVRFADQAVEYTEALLVKNGIDCAYVPAGNLLAGVHPKQQERLRRAAAVGADLGAQVRFVSESELRERGVPPAFVCGVLEERGGTLDPGRYVAGLRRAALASGVRLFEQSAVQVVEDDPSPRLRTEAGSVSAEQVVLATNAYTPELGWLRRAVVPVRVSLFETEPLGPDRLARLGWSGREGIYTAHEVLESYRLTDRSTIVGGSKVVRYGYGSRLVSGDDQRCFRAIESAFRQRFPQLDDVGIQHFWGGWIALTLDFLPRLGRVGRRGQVLHGLGYAGHGVAQATLVGRILADAALGREHPSAAALIRRSWDWPPEPFRWSGVQLLTRVLGLVDARTDRRARRFSRASGG